jgi:hypothetical protein
MQDKTYNGWTNYATWRVNLEMFDGLDAEFFSITADEFDDLVGSLAAALEEYAQSYIEHSSSGLARDYALAFLDDVNWHEIAQHMVADYADA